MTRGVCVGVSILLSAIGVPAQTARAQEIVANGSFEQPPVAVPWEQRLPGTSFGSWTVDSVGRGVAQIASFGQPLAIDGLQSVELNFYDACGIWQTLATDPGQRYVLTFLMAGQMNAGPDVKTMRVDWNGAELATVSWSRSATGGQWVRHTLTVLAASDATVLHFFGEVNEDGGPYVDAVSVTPSACPADFDGDGFVTGLDFDAYVAAFEAGEASTDFDGDGFVTGLDFDAFVLAFEEGC